MRRNNDSQGGRAHSLLLTERETTLMISKRRGVGGESWREWNDREKSSFVSQWDTEWDRPGPCGIGGNWSLPGFGREVIRRKHVVHFICE